MPVKARVHETAVVVDLQNMLGTASSLLPMGSRTQQLELDVASMARDLVQGRRWESRLHSVHVHTALPTAAQSVSARAIAQRYLRRLGRDPLVHVHARELTTLPDRSWRQVGVDTALGMSAMDLASSGQVDTIIVVSADRDFEPILRQIDQRGVHVEFARWLGAKGVWWHRKWVHQMDEHDLRRYTRWAQVPPAR